MSGCMDERNTTSTENKFVLDSKRRKNAEERVWNTSSVQEMVRWVSYRINNANGDEKMR